MRTLVLFFFMCLSLPLLADEWDTLPTEKMTAGGFYLTPEAARAAAMEKPIWSILIDIRQELQYADGKPDPTAIEIPFRQIDVMSYASETDPTAMDKQFIERVDAAVKDLGGNTSFPLILLCKTGKMSAIAANILIQHGYLRVYTIPDGFDGWKSRGLPIFKQEKTIE